MSSWSYRLSLLLALGLAACSRTSSETSASRSAAPSAARVVPTTSQATAASASASASTDAAAASPGHAALSAAEFRQLLTKLSEPDADFFSDNFISNETSYLQVAAELARDAKPGGVYLGVGPEQNFSYIALTRPNMAFIVDIRRDNLVLQLLYKAIFDVARSRSEFLTLLVGRPFDADAKLDRTADLEQVIAHAERLDATEDSYAKAHERLRSHLEQKLGIALSKKDARSLRKAHRAFFTDGLDIRFKLREKSFRRYPPLREVLAATDPAGQLGGFLATEAAFRTVQQLQRRNRVIPVVGNFGGDHALQAIGKYLTEAGLQVSVFYVSNVEQYLLQDGLWWKWQRNIEGLPTDSTSLFLRCYLDQGRRHPEQMKGHRTTSVLQRIADFHEAQRKRPYRSMFKLSTAPYQPVSEAASTGADGGR